MVMEHPNQPVTIEEMRQVLTGELLPTLERVLQTIKARDHELHALRQRVENLEQLARWQATESRHAVH